MAIQAYNYWIERIELKEKINKELMPQLDVFIGRSLTKTIANEMNKIVGVWVATLNNFGFACQLGVIIDKIDGIDVIKEIKVEQLYA